MSSWFADATYPRSSFDLVWLHKRRSIRSSSSSPWDSENWCFHVKIKTERHVGNRVSACKQERVSKDV